MSPPNRFFFANEKSYVRALLRHEEARQKEIESLKKKHAECSKKAAALLDQIHITNYYDPSFKKIAHDFGHYDYWARNYAKMFKEMEAQDKKEADEVARRRKEELEEEDVYTEARKKEYESLKKKHAECSKLAAALLDQINVTKYYDPGFKKLAEDWSHYDDWERNYAKMIQHMEDQDKEAADEAARRRKEELEEEDVYTDEENETYVFLVPRRGPSGQSSDNNQESSGFASRGGGGRGGGFGQSNDNRGDGRGGGLASRGDGRGGGLASRGGDGR
uniref:Uncharacterized protein n=1 Tax=Panagrolaimus sp. PS1159 TaxID=55785 RepID=A0AC35GCJ6_9BILA